MRFIPTAVTARFTWATHKRPDWVVRVKRAMTLGWSGLAVLVLASTIPAPAVQPDEILKDPVLEARARNLSEGLRCLVCQNQSIDESDAPLARDLRILIREQLQANKTDAEVLDFVVARYGDFVLLKPPFRGAMVLLWLAPFALLAGAGAFLFMRRSVLATGQDELSRDEERRLKSILDHQSGAKKP